MNRASVFVGLLGVASCGEIKTDASSSDDPKITSVSPDHGPSVGGITVTLSGTNLGGDNPVVLVDGVQAEDAMATSDTTVTFKLPPGREGTTVDITLGTDHGFAAAERTFKFNLRPVILDIEPQVGRFSGGTNVVVHGRGFQALEAGVPTLSIGGVPATNVQIIDDKTLMATTAAADPSTPAFTKIPVTLTNANGQLVVENAFTLTKQGIIATTARSFQLYWIDPVAKASVKLSNPTAAIGTCALAPDGTLYAKAQSAVSQYSLIRFDPLSRELEPVGKLTGPNGDTGISSMTFVGNKLYGISNSYSQFHEINPNTGALSNLGPVNGNIQRHSAIAIKDNNSVYQVNRTNGTLNTIAVPSGAPAVGPSLTGGNARGVHAMLQLGTTLYLAEEGSPSVVFSVNTTTGALTQVVSVPAQIAGMCQTPASF